MYRTNAHQHTGNTYAQQVVVEKSRRLNWFRKQWEGLKAGTCFPSRAARRLDMQGVNQVITNDTFLNNDDAMLHSSIPNNPNAVKLINAYVKQFGEVDRTKIKAYDNKDLLSVKTNGEKIYYLLDRSDLKFVEAFRYRLDANKPKKEIEERNIGKGGYGEVYERNNPLAQSILSKNTRGVWREDTICDMNRAFLVAKESGLSPYVNIPICKSSNSQIQAKVDGPGLISLYMPDDGYDKALSSKYKLPADIYEYKRINQLFSDLHKALEVFKFDQRDFASRNLMYARPSHGFPYGRLVVIDWDLMLPQDPPWANNSALTLIQNQVLAKKAMFDLNTDEERMEAAIDRLQQKDNGIALYDVKGLLNIKKLIPLLKNELKLDAT